MTGRMVDVGGYQLHLDCSGEGSPTVVMDAGLGGSSLDWALVQPAVARITRVCSYDRAGMGWSEPGPQPRSPGQIAKELHALLRNGEVPGPYILVGHSLAGKNIRMFAQAYPTEVAGMALIDARSELVERPADMETFASALAAQATQFSLGRRFGIARLFGGALVGEPLVPAGLATEMVLARTQPNAITATTQEGLSRVVDDEALAATGLGSMQLTVIAAGESMRNLPNWPEAQAAMAKLSTKGELVVAGNSGHAVQLAQPAVVIDAIDHLVAQVRSGH